MKLFLRNDESKFKINQIHPGVVVAIILKTYLNVLIIFQLTQERRGGRSEKEENWCW
jgi:hypothetical protein